jgi:hypothetical protein
LLGGTEENHEKLVRMADFPVKNVNIGPPKENTEMLLI